MLGCIPLARGPLSSRRARGAPLAALIPVLCLASPAAAQQPAPASAPDEEAVPATVQGLAEELAGQAARLLADLASLRLDLVLVLHPELPADAPGAATLTGLLGRLVTGSLLRRPGLASARVVEAAQGWPDPAAARARAGAEGYELTLWLSLTVEANHLVADGTLLDSERHLWRELVEPGPGLLGQLFARRRVDAELRRYLGPLAAGPGLSVRSLALGPAGYLALAVGDLDGDDRSELVLLRRDAIEVRRLRRDRAELLSRLSLADLPRAATRSRDAVGSLAVGPRGADGSRPVAARTSDHGRGLVVVFDGEQVRPFGELADYPLSWRGEEPLCSTVRPGRSAFETVPAPCRAFAASRPAPPFHGLAEALVARLDGPPGLLSAKVLADGRAALRWDDRPAGTFRSFGTAVAVTDVDDDGVAEVLLSSDREPGEGDELTVIRIDPAGRDLGRQALGSVPGSVWVAAAGDADDDGLRELLAVSESGTGARLLVIE